MADRLKLRVKAFRRECHRILPSERTTIHGADSMLRVLQLTMAEVNKQRCGEFKVALSDVLMAWKHLLRHKLCLPHTGPARPENHDLILEMYTSFLARSNTVDVLDVLSMDAQLRQKDSDPAEQVDPVQLFDFLSANGELSKPPQPSVPLTPSSRNRSFRPQLKLVVRKVFCSYLNLLVNVKDDLAVALTLDVPSRSLGRQAFTDLKRAARNSKTSLFLAATSFVRAIQLGGKGYAPAESDPLRKHVKGLCDFVQFLDNLEEILGEVSDPCACGARLVAAIRAALVKGRSSGDEVYAAADESAQELKEQIRQLHQKQKQAAGEGRTGISPARPKAHAINHATAYGGRDTLKVLVALLDEEALSPLYQNVADLLSEDQPILGGEEATSVLTMFRSPEVATGSSPEPLRNRVQSRLHLLQPKAKERVIRSQFSCTYGDERAESPLTRVLDFFSLSQAPTCVHPAPKRHCAEAAVMEKEKKPDKAKSSCDRPNVAQQSTTLRPNNGVRMGGDKDKNANASVQTESKSRKRKQADGKELADSQNQPPQKKSISAKAPEKSLSKGVSKKKLIPGQGKLTSFFRV